MKNLTVNRSALSKESMDVIENITNDENSSYDIYKEENIQSDVPEEYIREYDKAGNDNKSQEIDLLWQTFKSAQFNGGSPLLWGIGGFCSGIIVTLLVLALTGTLTFHKVTSNKDIKASVGADNAIEALEEEQNMNSENNAEVTDNSQSAAGETENAAVSPAGSQKYTIKDGDTVEAIIVHFYGAYTPERAQAIMKANNLDNLDRIGIGQVLVIPAEN